MTTDETIKDLKKQIRYQRKSIKRMRAEADEFADQAIELVVKKENAGHLYSKVANKIVESRLNVSYLEQLERSLQLLIKGLT